MRCDVKQNTRQTWGTKSAVTGIVRGHATRAAWELGAVLDHVTREQDHGLLDIVAAPAATGISV